MNKLFEQGWEEASKKAAEINTSITTTTTDIKPKGGGGDITSKDKGRDTTPKDNTIVTKKKDTSINTIYNSGFPVLLNSSIEFLKRFGPLTLRANFNEEKMYKLIQTYLIRNVINPSGASLPLIYADWIIRLARKGSDVNSLATKYQKQYNYILSQNGSRGTTLPLIFGIEKNPNLKSINSIFNPKSEIGNYLDMDSDSAASIRNSVRNGGIEYNEANTESTFKKPRTAEELNKIVLGGYDNKVYGNPLPQFQTKF